MFSRPFHPKGKSSSPPQPGDSGMVFSGSRRTQALLWLLLPSLCGECELKAAGPLGPACHTEHTIPACHCHNVPIANALCFHPARHQRRCDSSGRSLIRPPWILPTWPLTATLVCTLHPSLWRVSHPFKQIVNLTWNFSSLKGNRVGKRY